MLKVNGTNFYQLQTSSPSPFFLFGGACMFRKSPRRMTQLEVKHLEDYCQQHDIDTAEIDLTLDYYENQEYLKSLVHDVDHTFEPPPEEFMSPLQYYVAMHIYETEFEGKKPQPIVHNNLLRFSLRAMAPTGFEGSFSLRDYMKRH
jgi:hypothetical protein